MVAALTESLLSLASDPDVHFQVRNARQVRFPSRYQFHTHCHPEAEINYLSSGACIMGIGRQFVPLKEGDCILIYPGQDHSFLGDVQKASGLVQVEYQLLPDHTLLNRLPVFSQSAGYVRLRSCQELKTCLEQICRLCRETDSPWNQLKSRHLFFLLYIELCRYFEASPKRSKVKKDSRMTRFLACIQETYDQELNIEALSRQFELSSRSVRQYFQSEMGMKCSQYINMLRLNKAKELLWHTDKSVTEIALMTGFNSSQYFSRVFQSFTKMTPTAYRNIWHEHLPESLQDANGGKPHDKT